MAKRIPLQIFVGAFRDEDAVDAIEKVISSEEWESNKIVCTNLAIAKKDYDGEMKVKELGHPSSLQSAAVGGVVGGLIGGLSMLLLGPAGVMAGASAGGTAGAALAGYGASKIEGMDKDKLNKFGNALEPGSSGIVLVFDEVVVNKADFDEEIAAYKESTDALVELMSEKISDNLKKGNAIAYHLVFCEDGLEGIRTIVGPEALQIAKIVLTPEGFAGAQATATDTSLNFRAVGVTPDAMAAGHARLTSSVCVYEVAAVESDKAVHEAGVAVPAVEADPQ